MPDQAGVRIGVLIESDHIHREIHYYRGRFEEGGATVHLLTRHWGGLGPVYTDHDFHASLSLPFEDLNEYLDRGVGRLSAPIVPGGFVSDRLRYAEKPGKSRWHWHCSSRCSPAKTLSKASPATGSGSRR